MAMPSKNEVKEYVNGGIYHVYSRGINKNNIFLDTTDYSIFLYFLKRYLVKPNNYEALNVKNYYGEIRLLAFCLMPNHFHLLLKQNSKTSMAKFLQSLLVSYSMRFNKKYSRVGPLFQSRYKARLIKDEKDIVNMSKYIHQNPSEITSNLESYKYSSFSCYIHTKTKYHFVFSTEILSIFNGSKDLYRKYILEQI